MVRERPASARPGARGARDRNTTAPTRPASASTGEGGAGGVYSGLRSGGRVLQQQGHYGEGEGFVNEDEDERELLSRGTHETLTETWLSSAQEVGGSSYPWLERQQQQQRQTKDQEPNAPQVDDKKVANSGMENVAASLLDGAAEDSVLVDKSMEGENEEDLMGDDDPVIIDDDGGEDDDDDFDCDQWRGSRSTQPWRPESAVRGRPESANQRGGGGKSVWQWGAIDDVDDDELPQRLEPLRLPLLHMLEPLATKCQTGSIRKLVAFVEKGRADMCVSAVEDAARTLSKARGGGGDVAAVSKTAYRLVVVGIYCGLILVSQSKWKQAKEVLSKVLLLTGSYTRSYKYKTTLRVWTLVALAELHVSMGMPQVAFEYVETGIDIAESAKSLSCRLVCLVTRAALFCSTLQFTRAVTDCDCANRTLSSMEKSSSAGGGWEPFGKAKMNFLVSACVHHAHAISLLCQQPPRLKEAAEAASTAWAVASKLEDAAGAWVTTVRRGCLKVRDLLAGVSEGEYSEELMAKVRAATMRPLAKDTVEPKNSKTVAPKSTTVWPGDEVGPSGRSSSAMMNHGSRVWTRTISSAAQRAGEEERGAAALLLAVMEATLRESQELPSYQLDVAANLEVMRATIGQGMAQKGLADEPEPVVGGLGEGGVSVGVVAACERHMRGGWLRHSPIVQMRVSKAVHDFSTMLWSLNERGRHSEVVANIERLVGGMHLEGVEEALGPSSARDVCVALCIDCVDFGTDRFHQTQTGGRRGGGDQRPGPMEDALAYFGVALTLTQREEMGDVLRRVVRSWVFDCVAECHYLKGDYASCRSFLESAADACKVEDNEKESLSLTEIKYAVLAHTIECELRLGNALEALEVSLELLNMLKSCSSRLFKYSPKLPLGLRPAFARCAAIDKALAEKLQQQQPSTQIVDGDSVSDDAGSRFGIDVALWAPKLDASAASMKPGVGTRQMRRGQQRAVHSVRYLTAHVAYGCACASARVGKISDALSLVGFAQVNGGRCAESGGWDGEKGKDSLERRVAEAEEVLRYILREGDAPDASLFRSVISKEAAQGMGTGASASGMLANSALLGRGSVYHAMYQALTSVWEEGAGGGGRRPLQRPASASQLEVRRRILSAQNPSRGFVPAGAPPRPRATSTLAPSKGRPASALGVSREGVQVAGVGAARRRPASAMGAVQGGGWPGGGLERDEVRVARSAYGQRLRPASASAQRDERRRPASAAA